MKFRYNVSPEQQNNKELIRTTTGIGRLYSNYAKVQHLTSGDEVFDIRGLDSTKDGGNEYGNGYLIAETNCHVLQYWKKLQLLRNKLLVNSNWMKTMAMQCPSMKQENIVCIPYLQDFAEITQYYNNSIDFLGLSSTYSQYYKFYNISEFKQIKQVNELIFAFMQEFSNNEKVLLVLKYPFFRWMPNVRNKPVFVFNENPKIIIINNIIDNHRLFSLHKYCDAYVAPTSGAGWEIPAFHAMYFKNLLLCGKHTALEDWVDFKVAIELKHTRKRIKLFEYDFLGFLPFYPENSELTKHGLWDINYIAVDQIAKKIGFAYKNAIQTKELANQSDLTKFDINNINFFIQGGSL